MADDWDQFPQATPVDVALHAEGATGDHAKLVRAIYQQESSSGKNTETSNAGAVGGMQVTPGAFKQVADQDWDIHDPIDNARAGVRYARLMYDESGGDPVIAAAGYYGGPGGLEKAKQGIPVSDPRNPKAPNTIEYGQQVAQRMASDTTPAAAPSAAPETVPTSWDAFPEVKKPAGQIDLPAGVKPSMAGAGRGNVNPPAVAPAPPRSTLQELGRQLGLTARATVSGVASIPAMMSDAVTGPINAGLDAVAGKGSGFRFQPAEQALGNVMTAAGVPQPENATERVVQDVGSATTGAGSVAAAGKALARTAGPIASAVGDQLAAGPALQITSAATGAGAAGVTREEGGSPGAQIAAGLVGSLAPVGAMAARSALAPTKGTKQLQAAASTAADAGYVIPPADLNPGPLTEVASGVGGKVKTAQIASQRNQLVTNELTRKALGLPEDVPLNTEALRAIRKDAATAYGAVADAGTITPTPQYAAALDKAVQPYLSQANSFPDRKVPGVVADILALKTDAFDAGDAVSTIRVLRNESDAAFRGGDRLAGGALKQAAGALEDEIETHLTAAGEPAAEVLKQYRDARQTIAKTYTVEKALNPQTGNIDAQVLARELKKGKPLSEELKTIAQVAQAFPKATQALKEAPKELSVMDVAAGLGAAMKDPRLIVAPVARPIARSIMLSGPAQRAAVKRAGDAVGKPFEGGDAAAVEAAARAQGQPQPPVPTWDDFAAVPSQGATAAAAPLQPAPVIPAATSAPVPAVTLPAASAPIALPAQPAASEPAAPAQPQPAASPVPQPVVSPGPNPAKPDIISRIQQLRDAGESAAADHLQAQVDRDETAHSIVSELAGMQQAAPELPIHGHPEFTAAYTTMRQDGMKPAEAAARATMAGVVRASSQRVGLSPEALAAVLDKAKTMPLADVPSFAVKFVNSMAAKGAANPIQDPQRMVAMIGNLRDQAMQAAITYSYPAPQPPTAPATASQDVSQPASTASVDQVEAQTPAAPAAAEPPQEFAAQPRKDGTLVLRGDTRAIRDTLTAAGIPEASLMTMKGGVAVGAMQAPKVQAAIDRMQHADSIDQAAHEAATSPRNDKPEPSDAQIAAGNYAKGHVQLQGLDISIENPQGSTRRGVDPDGKPWESTLASHYGYVLGTKGNDGEHVDAFIGPDPDSKKVFVVDQVHPDGSFDEHKSMIGFNSREEAEKGYLANYSAGWQGLGAITELPMSAFKAWVASGHLKQPLGELQQHEEGATA